MPYKFSLDVLALCVSHCTADGGCDPNISNNSTQHLKVQKLKSVVKRCNNDLFTVFTGQSNSTISYIH